MSVIGKEYGIMNLRMQECVHPHWGKRIICERKDFLMSYIIKMALDIKAGFEPPANMSSPIEAYCAVGTIAKAMGIKRGDRGKGISQYQDRKNHTDPYELYPK